MSGDGGVAAAVVGPLRRLRQQPEPVDVPEGFQGKFYSLASVSSSESHLFAWPRAGSHREACNRVHMRY